MAQHRHAVILFVLLFLWLVLVSNAQSANRRESSMKLQRFRNSQQRLTRGRLDLKKSRSLSDMDLMTAIGYGKRTPNDSIHNANNFLLEWIALRGLMRNRGVFPREELPE